MCFVCVVYGRCHCCCLCKELSKSSIVSAGGVSEWSFDRPLQPLFPCLVPVSVDRHYVSHLLKKLPFPCELSLLDFPYSDTGGGVVVE